MTHGTVRMRFLAGRIGAFKVRAIKHYQQMSMSDSLK